MITEIITVVGISQKAEKKEGWLACVRFNTASWKTLLLPFDKNIFSTIFKKLGIYEVKLVDNSSFGEKPRYQIAEARLIVSFDEILKAYK